MFEENILDKTSALSVTELNTMIANALTQFPLLWVSGEVSNIMRAASGHYYFSLKDQQAQIRCVMYRGRAALVTAMPREGEHIEVYALISIYEPRGEVQLRVDALRRVGAGALYAAFIQLKEKLMRLGLFAAERKKPLPRIVQRIGIITSLNAAALHDVVTTLKKYTLGLGIVIYPSLVQGAQASQALIDAVRCAQQRNEVDILLLCRGGGSIEDLWAFNDEALAYAIAQCLIVTLSAFGHETDFTIADFVADHRAPTPTGAAELIGAINQTAWQNLHIYQQHFNTIFQRKWTQMQQRFDWALAVWHKVGNYPLHKRHYFQQLFMRLQMVSHTLLLKYKQQLHTLIWRFCESKHRQLSMQIQLLRQLQQRLNYGFERQFTEQQRNLIAYTEKLILFHPHTILKRGYALVTDNQGRTLTHAKTVQHQKEIAIHFAEDAVHLEIKRAHIYTHST